MIEVILIAVGLLVLAVGGMGIKMLFDRKAGFSGGSCQVQTEELREKGITCGCGGTCGTGE